MFVCLQYLSPAEHPTQCALPKLPTLSHEDATSVNPSLIVATTTVLVACPDTGDVLGDQAKCGLRLQRQAVHHT